MRVECLRDLYDYAYAARDRVLAEAARLDDAELKRPGRLSYGTLLGTLVHTLAGEVIWLARWQGESPGRLLAEEDLPSLDALRRRWSEEETKMRAFLASLDDATLERPLAYRSTSGRPYHEPLWQLLLHVFNHGTQHRSEAALVLSELGRSPGDLDLLFFPGRDAFAGLPPVEWLRVWYQGGYRAWRRLLSAAERVPEAELSAPRGVSHGSLYGVLAHALTGEAGWLHGWRSGVRERVLDHSDVPHLPSLRRLVDRQEGEMLSFLNGLSEQRLAGDFLFMYQGREQSLGQPLWQSIVHVANHGTQHRSEAAFILTELGASPGDLDLIGYIRERHG
jgi:uncharacterized damage-inducible protein DinB